MTPSGLSTLIQYRLPGGASRLAALLLPQIHSVFSVVAPCQPGAAHRQSVLNQRGQATNTNPCLRTARLLRTSAALLLAALAAPALTRAQAPTGPVTTVTGGAIRGLHLPAGGAVFKGIPYAAPPVGNLRWREPQPVVPWSGTREATAIGSSCPQAPFRDQPLPPISEDCLFLHVWTPDWPAAPGKPVMLWVHGGGNYMGNAVERGVMDGESLARHGVVVVSFNYRLGAFGFFAHPALSRESPRGASGNQGILDQIAALRWVRENIARFGGNPDNITLFGESAGSLDVNVLLATPLTTGMMHRAIGESGSVFTAGEPRGLAAAEQEGAALARNWLRAGEASPANLRAVSMSDILAADTNYGSAGAKWSNLGIVVDGYVFPENPAAIFAAGRQHPVPLILGSNSHDRIGTTQPADLQRSIGEQLGPLAARAATLYQGVPDPVHGTIEMQWDVDRTFRCPSVAQLVWHASAGHSAWQYEFARVMPGERFASHAVERRYVFGTHRRAESRGAQNQAGPDEKDDRISEAMQRYWTNFAKRGDPNGPGVPVWPKFEPSRRAFVQFADAGAVAGEGLRRATCELWVQSLDGKYRGR